MKLKNKLITLSPTQRLLQSTKPIIAITGGIASGKSTVTQHLKSKGFPIVCADSIVKQIYQTSAALKEVKQIAPHAVKRDTIIFAHLREEVFTNPQSKEKIENFIFKHYPQFLQQAFNQIETSFILYDIPLLFEKKLNQQVDQAVCVYCPTTEQLKRIIQRDNCSMEIAQKIIAHQLPIEQKRRLANYVIDNSATPNALISAVDKFITDFFGPN